jgi:hypothetical protein
MLYGSDLLGIAQAGRGQINFLATGALGYNPIAN